MYTFKGFLGIEDLVLNEPNATSAIGEISTQSLTYSKNVGLYPSTAYPQLMLYAFSSHFSNGLPALVPAEISAKFFELAQWVYTRQTSAGAATLQTAFLQDVVDQFGQLSGNTTMIDCGAMVQAANGAWFPEWLSCKFVGLPLGHPAADNSVFVWLSDHSFSRQYDEFSIVVVPPLASLETFFSGSVKVKAALAARSLPEVMVDVQLAKEGHPESIVAAENYDYIDPLKPSVRVPTAWTLLIYGKAGEDVDAIRDAVRTYIAANSSRAEAEWRLIFPDIYKFTEVMVYPRWHNYAIADRALQSGVYSPVVKLGQELTYLKARLPIFAPSFIDAHASVMPCNYKSLALLAVGTPDNRNALFNVGLIYPDLINVPTSDTLFEMMAESTQTWVLLLERAIMLAESLSIYADVPPGFRKVGRSGVLYVSFRLDNITYLVASKATTPVY